MAKTGTKRPTPRKRNTQKLMRKIRQEAKALGLSQAEYLRLTLALSTALRESLGDSGIDTKTLLTFVESPMFSLLLGSIAKTAIQSVNSSEQKSDNGPAGQSDGLKEPTNGPQPYNPMRPYMPQQPPMYGGVPRDSQRPYRPPVFGPSTQPQHPGPPQPYHHHPYGYPYTP